MSDDSAMMKTTAVMTLAAALLSGCAQRPAPPVAAAPVVDPLGPRYSEKYDRFTDRTTKSFDEKIDDYGSWRLVIEGSVQGQKPVGPTEKVTAAVQHFSSSWTMLGCKEIILLVDGIRFPIAVKVDGVVGSAGGSRVTEYAIFDVPPTLAASIARSSRAEARVCGVKEFAFSARAKAALTQ